MSMFASNNVVPLQGTNHESIAIPMVGLSLHPGIECNAPSGQEMIRMEEQATYACR
jgi:hypothetical protein